MSQHHAAAKQEGLKLARPILLLGLSVTIPAFYLVLTAVESGLHNVGRYLYILASLIILFDLGWQMGYARRWFGAWRSLERWRAHWIEIVILVGAIVSALRQDQVWSHNEWLLRLVLCGIIFIRLALLFSCYIKPHRMLPTFSFASLMVLLAGGGFYWLEPTVTSFADGIWLAFTTLSTVGYGDLVPSNHASRLFAVFIVLLGYALFSVLTASIAALFIGEDEKRLQRELHADIRALHLEVAALRADLQREREANQINP